MTVGSVLYVNIAVPVWIISMSINGTVEFLSRIYLCILHVVCELSLVINLFTFNTVFVLQYNCGPLSL